MLCVEDHELDLMIYLCCSHRCSLGHCSELVHNNHIVFSSIIYQLCLQFKALSTLVSSACSVQELWAMLHSANHTVGNIPQQILDAKQDELKQKKEQDDALQVCLGSNT